MLSAIMSVLDWIKQGAITAYWIHPSFFCCRLESGSWLEHRGYSSAPLLSSCFRTGYNSSIVLRVCTKLDVPGKAVEETVQEACESDTQTTTSDSCRPEEASSYTQALSLLGQALCYSAWKHFSEYSSTCSTDYSIQTRPPSGQLWPRR